MPLRVHAGPRIGGIGFLWVPSRREAASGGLWENSGGGGCACSDTLDGKLANDGYSHPEVRQRSHVVTFVSLVHEQYYISSSHVIFGL